jgi:hypothetical protein
MVLKAKMVSLLGQKADPYRAKYEICCIILVSTVLAPIWPKHLHSQPSPAQPTWSVSQTTSATPPHGTVGQRFDSRVGVTSPPAPLLSPAHFPAPIISPYAKGRSPVSGGGWSSAGRQLRHYCALARRL